MRLYSSSRVERVYLIQRNFGRFSSLFTTATNFNARRKKFEGRRIGNLQFNRLDACHRENKVAAFRSRENYYWLALFENRKHHPRHFPASADQVFHRENFGWPASRKEIYDLAWIQWFLIRPWDEFQFRPSRFFFFLFKRENVDCLKISFFLFSPRSKIMVIMARETSKYYKYC